MSFFISRKDSFSFVIGHSVWGRDLFCLNMWVVLHHKKKPVHAKLLFLSNNFISICHEVSDFCLHLCLCISRTSIRGRISSVTHRSLLYKCYFQCLPVTLTLAGQICFEQLDLWPGYYLQVLGKAPSSR